MPDLREAIGAERLKELGRKFRAAKDHVPTRCAGGVAATVRSDCVRPRASWYVDSCVGAWVFGVGEEAGLDVLVVSPAKRATNRQPIKPTQTDPTRPHPSAPNSLLARLAVAPLDYVLDRWRFGAPPPQHTAA
jgi:hypothetical protein